MATLDFELAPDAPPMVRGVYGTLKRAAAQRRLAKRIGRMKGVLALRSSVDPQSVTVRFDRGRVRLEPGVAPDAGVVITLDITDPVAKPKVKGAARHLLFALGVAKVLEPPAKSWPEEAADFWEFAKDAPHMPRSLLVVCTDDGAQARFGEGQPTYEVHGTAKQLAGALSGSSILLEEVIAGRLLVVGTMEHASAVGGRAIAWTMGEGR